MDSVINSKVCSQRHLIIFTRYPEAGKTKTRLIPALGAVGAADLHRRMAEYTLEQVKELQQMAAISVEVRFVGGSLLLMQEWLGKDLIYHAQDEGDLGARMWRSLNSAFDLDAEQVVMIGTDCPGINSQILTTAFEQLSDCDLVLGPALDGGYYLIGMKQPIPELFRNIQWGSSLVFAQTIAIAQQQNLSFYSLPPLTDIDRPEDLSVLPQYF